MKGEIKMCKLSIIVPVYNGEKYIKKTIDSILDQTFENFELILINDGSTDRTREILEECKERDKRLRVIHQENSGPGAARNVGIREARGEYIGFVDGDDCIDKKMYEKLLDVAVDNKIEMAMCGYTEISAQDEVIVRSNLPARETLLQKNIEEDIISTFIKNINFGYFALWNKIYYKKFILDNDLFIEEDRKQGEDWWFNIRAFCQLQSFVYIDEPLYYYIRQNSESLMSAYNESNIDYLNRGYEQVLPVAKKYQLDTEELEIRRLVNIYGYLRATMKYNRKRFFIIRDTQIDWIQVNGLLKKHRKKLLIRVQIFYRLFAKKV